MAHDSERDRLTIGRMLLLTAGVAVGLGVFAPEVKRPLQLGEPDRWLMFANAILIGLSLPLPLLAFRLRRPDRVRLGAGGLFALAAGLGAWTMLPPACAQRLKSGGSEAAVCLVYVLPLMAVWWLLATVAAGQLRSTFSGSRPWFERFGSWLAVLWMPLGLWQLSRFYLEMFR